jgi:hypothetical protein
MIAVTHLSYAIAFGVCSSRSFIASSSCHQVYDVTKAIIQKFPYLCEKIGSGYDGWYICIKDKLKNVRRKSDEPSATCRKKLKMSDKILTSVARKRSFPKASSNISNLLCNVV